MLRRNRLRDFHYGLLFQCREMTDFQSMSALQRGI